MRVLTREATCTRCGGERWTPDPDPYVCQRCREVLSGTGVVFDPLTRRLAALAAGRAAHRVNCRCRRCAGRRETASGAA